MSTKSAPPPAPLAPPDEEFWDKYSPHHEFPLSTIGSVAMHIGVFAALAGLLWLAYKSTISDKTPVPVRAMIVAGDNGPEGRGGGGGEAGREDVDPTHQTIPKDVPQAKLEDANPEIKQYLPKVPSPTAGLRPEDLPSVPRFAGLDPELQKKLLEGASGKKGKGPGDGAGGPGPEGDGAGNSPNPSSSTNRSIRWQLNFDTKTGEDHLAHLRAMKATLLMPQPADWKTYKAYRLTEPRIVGEEFDISKLHGLYFVDDDSGSAPRLARAMGLAFSPPMFLAFFPKDIEEELARKEREFRGRKESEIFSTTFKVLIRDGKPTITVIEQVPVRK